MEHNRSDRLKRLVDAAASARVAEGISSGYDSVMIDGSRLPFEENVEVTSQVVAMAHAAGVLVEAELGSVFSRPTLTKPSGTAS